MDASTLQRNLGGYPVFPFVYDYETCQLLAAPIYFREDMGIGGPADEVNFHCGKIAPTQHLSWIRRGTARLKEQQSHHTDVEQQPVYFSLPAYIHHYPHSSGSNGRDSNGSNHCGSNVKNPSLLDTDLYYLVSGFGLSKQCQGGGKVDGGYKDSLSAKDITKSSRGTSLRKSKSS
ncbi:hypothetical protein STEG23_019644 [Scotinomys teguina]